MATLVKHIKLVKRINSIARFGVGSGRHVPLFNTRLFSVKSDEKPHEYCIPTIWRGGSYVSDGPRGTVETFSELSHSDDNLSSNEILTREITNKVLKDIDHNTVGTNTQEKREAVEFQLFP